MVLTSHKQSPPSREFSSYIKKEFNLNENALQLGIKQSIQENAPLSIILLSYGLISLNDYQKLLDWLEQNK